MNEGERENNKTTDELEKINNTILIRRSWIFRLMYIQIVQLSWWVRTQ